MEAKVKYQRIMNVWSKEGQRVSNILLVWHDRAMWSQYLLHTAHRTPWTGDQPVATPLPTQNNTNTEKIQKHTLDSSGIRTHDPNFRAVKNSTLHRRGGNCDGIYYSHYWFWEFCFLGYNALQYVESLPTFRRNMSPLSSALKGTPSNKPAWSRQQLFYFEAPFTSATKRRILAGRVCVTRDRWHNNNVERTQGIVGFLHNRFSLRSYLTDD
jgi:hypothetical protein